MATRGCKPKKSRGRSSAASAETVSEYVKPENVTKEMHDHAYELAKNKTVDLRDYYTDKEIANMSEFQLTQLYNLAQNYWMLKEIGMKSILPIFMVPGFKEHRAAKLYGRSHATRQKTFATVSETTSSAGNRQPLSGSRSKSARRREDDDWRSDNVSDNDPTSTLCIDESSDSGESCFDEEAESLLGVVCGRKKMSWSKRAEPIRLKGLLVQSADIQPEAGQPQEAEASMSNGRERRDGKPGRHERSIKPPNMKLNKRSKHAAAADGFDSYRLEEFGDYDRNKPFRGFSSRDIARAKAITKQMDDDEAQFLKAYSEGLVTDAMYKYIFAPDRKSCAVAQQLIKADLLAEHKKTKTRYPKRNIERKNYCEIEFGTRDEFFTCAKCHVDHMNEPCPILGPLEFVKDTPVDEVPMTTTTITIGDSSVLLYNSSTNGAIAATGGRSNRAATTIPPCFKISDSGIPGSGLGVWVKSDIKAGLIFGPYEGLRVTSAHKAHQSGYCWEILDDNNKLDSYVDGKNVRTANWMRYVNCALSEDEQNLVATQYRGGIYYQAKDNITAGQELLVWYGEEYAEELGLVTATTENETGSSELAIEFEEATTSVKESSAVSPGGSNAKDMNAIEIPGMPGEKKKNKKKKEKFVASKQPIQEDNIENPEEMEQKKKKHKKKKNRKSIGQAASSLMDEPLLKDRADEPLDIPTETSSFAPGREVELSTSNSFKCTECQAAFINSQSLAVHTCRHALGEVLYKKHKYKKHKCAMCDASFDHLSVLMQHTRAECPSKNLVSSQNNCQPITEMQDTKVCAKRIWSVHLGAVSVEVMDNVDNATNMGSSVETVGNNMRTGVETVESNTGNGLEAVGSNTESSIKDGSESKTLPAECTQDVFRCEMCGYNLASKRSLQLHKTRVHGRDQLSKTERVFSVAGETTTTNQIKPYHCDHCWRSFRTAVDLTVHVQIIHSESSSVASESHQCKGSGKQSTSIRYKCTTCNASLTCKRSLVLHMRTHSGERPYACTVCTATFTRRNNLNSHMRTHTGERPYSCYVCGATFTRSDILRRHAFTHTGERPFKCLYCSAAYTESFPLSKHVKRKHQL